MKKALSIVLSIAVMLSMCVGFSIVASADAVELPGKPYGADNYAALSTAEGYQNNTAPLPVVDEDAGTITLGATANGTSRAEFDLNGLTAEDDYVVSFTAGTIANWHSSTWGLQIAMTTDNGAIGKAQSFIFAGTNNHKFTGSDEVENASFSKALSGTYKFDIYVDADAATSTRTYHVYVNGEWVYTSPSQPAIEPQLAFVGSRGGSNSWNVANLCVYKAVTDLSSITPAGKNVNMALDPETIVSLTDKAGTATFNNGSISFEIKDAAVNTSFSIPAGALDDEYVVAFNAEMNGGWESNGVALSFGTNAVIKLVKGSADTTKNDPQRAAVGGELYFNDELIKTGDMRSSLVTANSGANIVAHVKSAGSGKSNIAFYYNGTLLGTMKKVVVSNTISIGSAISGWGDKLILRNIKIMNNTDLIPTPGSGNTGSGSGNTGSGSGNTGSGSGSTGSGSGSTGSGSGSTGSTAPTVKPAKKDVNLATDKKTDVVVIDKAQLASFDKKTSSIDWADHRDAAVKAIFDTNGRVADRYIVSFTAAMKGGWESNGVQISWGQGATISLVKAHALGGKIVINGEEIVYDGIRNALISGTADILAYVYPSSKDATKSNVDIYLGTTKLATMKDVVTSDVITIGSVCGAWGDSLKLSNIKIMNDPSLVPGGASDGAGGDGSTGGNTNGVIVDGVDTSKKGTGKDIEILAPADPKNPKKNLADVTKLKLPEGITLADGIVTMQGGVDLTFDMSSVKATDDYIISFKAKSLSWWPHEYMTITFGQGGSARYVWTFKGNARPNGASTDKNTFEGVVDGQGTKVEMTIPNNTLQETQYVIYVTTSPETGKRRIFFFANNKPLTAVGKDGAAVPLVIEDQDVLTPCLTFRSHAGSAKYEISNIEAYVAKAPSFKEALIDKTYTTPPIPNPDAKNWAQVDQATLVGAAEVKEDGTIVAPGGDAPASSVTIPLGGLTKKDAYVISFMTTTCSYDDWQSLSVVFGKEGEKDQRFILRGSTAYSSLNVNGSETRIKAMAAKGSLTKIDILVMPSVETGNRRIMIFQDGQACVLYNTPTETFETKSAEFITPTLTFSGGKNGTFNITNLKVYKMNQTKGWSGLGGANTGNPSQAAGALAVTAAIALPVIFFARKKKEEN